jgi:hypothetical protein
MPAAHWWHTADTLSASRPVSGCTSRRLKGLSKDEAAERVRVHLDRVGLAPRPTLPPGGMTMLVVTLAIGFARSVTGQVL